MITLLKAMALTGGEWVIYLLILCSILAVAVIVERALILKREKKEMKSVRTLFAERLENQRPEELSGQLKEFSCLTAKVLTAGFSKVNHGVDTVEEEINSMTSQEKRRLEVRMIVLSILGNNAVYIGLFGTVLGVIKAFRDLAQEVGAGPEVVMQGLSEALIATAVGLLVALPCVAANNVLQNQINNILSETESMVHLLMGKLKSKK